MLSGRKQRIVREACRADSPSREPCCVVPAGTREGISESIHAANFTGRQGRGGSQKRWQTQRKFVWVRVESCVTLVDSIFVYVSRAEGAESSIIDCKARKVKSADRWARHPPCYPRSLPCRDFDAPCEMGWLCAWKRLPPWPEREPQPEAAVSFRTVVTFSTWLRVFWFGTCSITTLLLTSF